MSSDENKVSLAEIARLHAVNDRLRAEIERLRAMVFRPVTLTDAEREAVEAMAHWCEVDCGHCRDADERTAADHYAARAATLRGLLERLSDRPKPINNDSRLAALEQLADLDQELGLPAWTSRPYYVDPPSGWQYGFPRLYDPASDGDMTQWLIANGYPERLARQGLACTFTEWTETGEK